MIRSHLLRHRYTGYRHGSGRQSYKCGKLCAVKGRAEAEKCNAETKNRNKDGSHQRTEYDLLFQLLYCGEFKLYTKRKKCQRGSKIRKIIENGVYRLYIGETKAYLMLNKKSADYKNDAARKYTLD